MTKRTALWQFQFYGEGWCVVRWPEYRGGARWTIEAIWVAEKAITDHGPDFCQIIARHDVQGPFDPAYSR